MRGIHRSAERARALTAFFGSAILFGFGAAFIDQTAAGKPLYYVGWIIVVTGVLYLFSSAERALFRPLWAFGAAFLVEIYGWWNVFWMLADVTECGGCHFDRGVALANFGAILPVNDGIVYLPFWTFVISSLAAVVVPILVARYQKRGVIVRRSYVPERLPQVARTSSIPLAEPDPRAWRSPRQSPRSVPFEPTR